MSVAQEIEVSVVKECSYNKGFGITFVKKEKIYIKIKLGDKSMLLPVDNMSTVAGLHDSMQSFIDDLMLVDGAKEVFAKHGVIIE